MTMKKTKQLPESKKITVKLPPKERKLKDAPDVVIAKAIQHLIIKDREKEK